jgi:hypothetical protein
MKNVHMFLFLCCLGVAAQLISLSASAGVINMSRTTTLFYDDFETAANGVSHATYPDAGDYDPSGGAVGVWSISEESEGRQVQVTDATGTNGPGPNQGKNYLRLVRGTYSDFSAGECFTVQNTTGDHIHWEQMLYAGSSAADANPLQIIGQGTTGNRFNILTSYSPGYGSIGSYTGNWPPTAVAGVTYVADKWQKWEIDYNIGDAFLKLTVDGASASNIPIISGGDLGCIQLVSSSIGYADEIAVPEPSSVALLSAGLIGLLAFAWKKRK